MKNYFNKKNNTFILYLNNFSFPKIKKNYYINILTN